MVGGVSGLSVCLPVKINGVDNLGENNVIVSDADAHNLTVELAGHLARKVVDVFLSLKTASSGG